MMGSFTANRSAIRQVTHQPYIKAHMKTAAEAVAEAAKQKAPALTGRYRRGIKPRVIMTSDGWTGQVIGWHFTSHFVEFGLHGVKKSRVLASALDVVGNTAKVGPWR